MLDRDLAASRRAARLCGATVIWNLVVGSAAVATAAITGSLALIGFGVNAVVDSSVSSLLVWRFGAQAPERADRIEHVALRVAGWAFTVIAVYLGAVAWITGDGSYDVWGGLVAIPVLILLTAAVAAYASDCGGMTTPEQAMQCFNSMRCSSHGHHGQEYCKIVAATHAVTGTP